MREKIKLVSSAKTGLFYTEPPPPPLTACLLSQRYRSKKKAFQKSAELWKDNTGGSLAIDENFKKIKKYCKFVRAICHTQVSSGQPFLCGND